MSRRVRVMDWRSEGMPSKQGCHQAAAPSCRAMQMRCCLQIAMTAAAPAPAAAAGPCLLRSRRPCPGPPMGPLRPTGTYLGWHCREGEAALLPIAILVVLHVRMECMKSMPMTWTFESVHHPHAQLGPQPFPPVLTLAACSHPATLLSFKPRMCPSPFAPIHKTPGQKMLKHTPGCRQQPAPPHAWLPLP